MDHEFYEEALDEVDGFIAEMEMEMEIEEQRLKEAEGEKNLRLLEKALGLGRA